MTVVTDSAEQTRAFAAEIGRRLRPGDVVAFRGGLGAGKTAFTSGLLRGLGRDVRVTSPTFAIVNDYGGSPRVLHFDMYRITDPDSLYYTGWYDLLDGENILIVEWSENIETELPDDPIVVDIETLGETKRRITVSGGVFDEAAGA